MSTNRSLPARKWLQQSLVILLIHGLTCAGISPVNADESSDLNDPVRARKDAIVVEALIRLPDVNVNDDPKYEAAVARQLLRLKDDPAQLRLIRELRMTGQADRLIQFASNREIDSASVQAIDMALKDRGMPAIKSIVIDASSPHGGKLIEILGLSNAEGAHRLLLGLVGSELLLNVDPSDGQAVAAAAQRKLAAGRGLARSINGQKALLELAQERKLPAEVRLIVGPMLRVSNNADIAKASQDLFPAPITKAKSPLRPVFELSKAKGNSQKGKEIFATLGTCANCHIVAGQGKAVGPDLSEIGSKLSREAMYVSILEPSAGISHGYENYAALLESDQVINGLLISKTDAEVKIRDAQGIERTVATDDLVELKKMEKSLMPDNLQENLTEQDLIDLVEYMCELTKK